MRCRGRVVFQRADSLANPSCSPGAGFALSGLSTDDERAIAAFLHKRAPMFWIAPSAQG
jgi:hypothetical protein